METLNTIHVVNYLPTSRSQASLPPSSSSSSSSSSSLSFASRFHDRNSFVLARKQRQISFRLSSNSLAGRNSRKMNNMGSVFSARCSAGDQSGGPAGKPSKSWRNWVIGFLLSVALPWAHNRWAKLLAVKNKVETVVKTAETVVEVVEEVAEGVAKVADEVADHLPEGGKFKSAVEIVENVAKETAKDAHIADQLIEKVEEVEKEVASAIVGKAHDNEMNIEATKDEVTKGNSNQKDTVHETATEVTHDQGTQDANHTP